MGVPPPLYEGSLGRLRVGDGSLLELDGVDGETGHTGGFQDGGPLALPGGVTPETLRQFRCGGLPTLQPVVHQGQRGVAESGQLVQQVLLVVGVSEAGALVGTLHAGVQANGQGPVGQLCRHDDVVGGAHDHEVSWIEGQIAVVPRSRLVPRSRAVKLSSAVSNSASMALDITPERLSSNTTPLAARHVAATRFSNSSISPLQ